MERAGEQVQRRAEHGTRGFARGALECLAVVAGFLAFGLGWAALERATASDAAPYTRGTVEAHDPDPSAPPAAEEAQRRGRQRAAARVWLVDGYNALHAGVLRGRERRDWWKAPAQALLVARAERFDDAEAEIWVVFDASAARPERCPEPASTRVHLVFTPSADDWLVKRVRAAPEPGGIAVVTGDRQVAGRVRQRGAAVVSPLAFLARCGPGEEPQAPGSGAPGAAAPA